MTILKTLTIVAALLTSGTSLAIAQNGLPTGGQTPVAGGANGGGWAGGWWYGGAPGLRLPALVCLLSALPPPKVSALLNRLAVNRPDA
jgi:hypothetical protein